MKDVAGGFTVGAFGGVIVGFVGFMIWGVAAVGFGIEGDWEYFAYTWTNFWMFTAGGAALGGLIGAAKGLQERENRARSAAAGRRSAADAEKQRMLAARQSAQSSVAATIASAEKAYRSLPVLLGDAASHHESAMRHRESGAYSPFWAAVENACVRLGEYDHALASINSNAARYAAMVKEYKALGGRDTVSNFPVDVHAIQAARAGEVIAAAVRGLAYEAQRDPVYAQIWEQRRTTAAIVQGFRSMEAAIDGLAQAVESSVAGLVATVGSLGASVDAIGTGVRMANAAAATQNARVAGKLDEVVWYLNNERDRAIGWRTY